MTNFKFKEVVERGRVVGYDVRKGAKSIGEIRSAKEPSGRHSFYIATDTRKKPRLYRGKQMAAEALLVLTDIVKNAKAKRMSPEMVVLTAWSSRPSVSDQ